MYSVFTEKKIPSLDVSSLMLCHLILTKCNIYSEDINASSQTAVFFFLSLSYSGSFGGGWTDPYSHGLPEKKKKINNLMITFNV